MIYQVLRVVVRISLSIFFKKIVVTGTENIPDEGPMIIVSNHPNTLMDPLIIASITERRIGFIGNASIFANQFLIAIFKYFHVIPIYRKKDIAPGEKPDNTSTFIKCHEYLNEGKTFLIFPEGDSYYELKLRDIKTGTARIALSYEALKNFEGNLKILPVTLDYSDSLQFRSLVAVTVNPPLSLGSYRDAYARNEFECVKTLTQDIKKELARNIPHTSGKDQEDFLIKAHRFYTAYNEPEADLYDNPGRSLELRKQLSRALHQLHDHNQELYADTQKKMDTFFGYLKEEGLTTGFFTDQFLKRSRIIVCLNYFTKFLLLLPLYLAGLLLNYLPYILPSKIFAALKIDKEYTTSVELVAGLITFPIFYTLEIWLFNVYVYAGVWSTLLLIILLPATGYLAMYYWMESQRFVRVLHFYFVMKSGRKSELLALRNDILESIEKARAALA